ncbi:MAG TPA: hypothetical protein VKD22_13910 [Ramlibacter sp.]|nr:hypothetical protein [Ramlibacter sp.]
MPAPNERSEFFDALRKGLLLGTAILVLILPVSVAPPLVRHAAPRAIVRPLPIPVPARPRFPDFAGNTPSDDVRHMANWIVQSDDNGRRSFIIVDKKDAEVYVFNPRGHLQALAPALLGQTRGDDSAPGIGDTPIADVRPDERTTPAGRFVAELGESASRHEDVVWVDYKDAVSMHRVIRVPARLKALASPTKDDNRMSYGCINLPPWFYEQAVHPAVARTGAIIYVLPETRSLHEEFPAYHDVPEPLNVAAHD